MAGIYDIHCHLNDNIYLDLEKSSTDIISDATRAGISIINCIGYDIKSSKQAIILATKHPNVYAIIGIHPTQAHLYTEDAFIQIEDWVNANKVVAIGETGLDFSKGTKYKNQQIYALNRQIDIALKNNLPLMLHAKDEPDKVRAHQELLKILIKKKVRKAVIHSFNSTYEIARKYLINDYFISINGQITTSKQLQSVVKKISLNNIMVESDAPYNTPYPYQKIVNEPKYLPIIIDKIAALRKIESDEVISATSDNAKKLFKIKE